ncbi:MAG: FAD-dependent oxidoreductase [Pseudomonadota bacterium]
MRLQNQPRVAIAGGGPGGLSLARLLKDQGFQHVTVFEAEPRVGGKSWTFYSGGAVVEMGTCYTTLSHKIVKRWMKRFKMKLRRNGEMKFDGREFMDYVRQGAGPPFGVQALRYFWGGWRLRRRLARTNPPQSAIDEAAMSTLDWLRARRLPKIELFLHRILTLQGYGFLDETAAIQAHRWCDIPLFLSGALNQLHMPEDGWYELWRRLAEDLDVRVDTPVTRVERDQEGVWVETPKGRERFDQIVCAMPLDEFAALGEANAAEARVNAAVAWQGYTTSLIAADNWFTEWHVEAYSDTARPGAPLGKLLGARRETIEPELGGRIYVIGQLSRGLTPEELRDIALSDLERVGVNVTNFIMQKSWKYFAQYDRKAVAQGLLNVMRRMQGEQRTWYTGATFSHEAVSNIVNFNAQLSKDMRNALLPPESAA